MAGDNPAVMRGGEVASPVHEEGNASEMYCMEPRYAQGKEFWVVRTRGKLGWVTITEPMTREEAEALMKTLQKRAKKNSPLFSF